MDSTKDPLAAFTFGQTELQIRVLYDLITHYNELFDVTEREIVARHRVNECASRLLPDVVAHHVSCDSAFGRTPPYLSCLTNHHSSSTQSNQSQHKPASGMLIAVHLFSKDINSFNVQSTLTADAVLSFATKHKSLDAAKGPYALFEAARDGQLGTVDTVT